MSRYRLYPTPEQEAKILDQCAHARFVWNLCVEQESWWRRWRGRMYTHSERCRQLTEARAEFEWLREGAQVVQANALEDFTLAMRYFFAGTHGRPTWRKQGRDEGFWITGRRGTGTRSTWEARRLNRNWGEVKIPKVGWVRFRWSRQVSAEARSFRVKRDRSGRWHVAFMVPPEPIAAPGNSQVVGIDRGIAVSATLSTGEMLKVPGLSKQEAFRLLRLQRRMAKASRGSRRRAEVKVAAAKLRAREASRRKDWVEKTSTDIARRFDMIRVEDLNLRGILRSARGTAEAPGKNIAQKTGLNRGVGRSGWGALVRRLEDKAPGRVERINPAYTSQRCSACGHVDRESRKSQAHFRCTACSFACNADVNAAINIAAGHAVNARGGFRVAGPVNREPQLVTSLVG